MFINIFVNYKHVRGMDVYAASARNETKQVNLHLATIAGLL
jgi:hypothetical protein